MKQILKLTATTLFIGLFTGCSLLESLDDPTPTETLMRENMWEVTAVYDENAPTKNILSDIQLGLGSTEVPFIFNMKEHGKFTCTAEPLFLYLVYGDSKWTQIAGQIDQIFDYLDGNAIEADKWGIGDGEQNQFMIEATLQPPGAESFISILEDVFGLEAFSQKLDQYVMHKFKFVDVSFENGNMVWEITDSTETEYYTEKFDVSENDYYKVPFTIQGTRFSRCRIEFSKWSPISDAEIKIFNKLE